MTERLSPARVQQLAANRQKIAEEYLELSAGDAAGRGVRVLVPLDRPERMEFELSAGVPQGEIRFVTPD